MGGSSLDSASQYLNNLLLARGLLQNGKPLDFTATQSDTETQSRIINLVHDLILRRDRDAEQREKLGLHIRSIRAEEAQRVLDLQRVQDKNAELTREATTFAAQERALKNAARKAELQAKDMKEQMLKMKSMLDQVRAKCLSEVKKRDVEIEKLKGHLTGMQRGKREASGMKVITLNPPRATNGGGSMRGGEDVNSTEWSLEKETNDFLAALVNETSTENVMLRKIVGDTMETLRELTGLQKEVENAIEEEDGIGIPGQYRKSRMPQMDSVAQKTLVSCDALTAEMSEVLTHCATILRDPSFVPIEEVQIREEEILKLRTGWVKMANRWKEAVTMMDTWRRKMIDGRDPVDVNELSQLDFGKSRAVMPDGQPVISEDDELSSLLYDQSRPPLEIVDEEEQVEEAEIEVDEHIAVAAEDEESELELELEPAAKLLAASPARRGLRLPRPMANLKEIEGNTLTSRVPSTGQDVPDLSHSIDGSADSSCSIDLENDTFQHKIKSRIPQKPKKETLPALSVPEKLAAVEAEAREAEAVSATAGVKRKHTDRQASRKSRRRSTLHPEELAELMGVC